jgi:hypothetical protein
MTDANKVLLNLNMKFLQTCIQRRKELPLEFMQRKAEIDAEIVKVKARIKELKEERKRAKPSAL